MLRYRVLSNLIKVLVFLYQTNYVMIFIYFGPIWFFLSQMSLVLQSIIDQSLSFLYFYNFTINFLYFTFSSIWFFMQQMALVLLVKLKTSSSEFYIKNVLLFILTIIPLILCMICSKYEYVTKKHLKQCINIRLFL